MTLEIWAEMPHVWHAFAGMLPEADEAVERIGRWLREDRPPGEGAQRHAGARACSYVRSYMRRPTTPDATVETSSS